jgi:hypothetical protein
MAASDHLSQPQFFHATDAEFKPGDVLSREGAWRAGHPDAAAKLDQNRTESGFHPEGWRYGYGAKLNNDNHPMEDHLYYGDRGFVQSGEASSYGKNLYAVEHVTKSGRPSNTHKPDPHYTNEGMAGAYRTTNRLRVVGKADRGGNLL